MIYITGTNPEGVEEWTRMHLLVVKKIIMWVSVSSISKAFYCQIRYLKLNSALYYGPINILVW